MSSARPPAAIDGRAPSRIRALARPAWSFPVVLVGLNAWLVLATARQCLADPAHSISWMGLAILHLPVHLVVTEPSVVHEGGEPVFVWLNALWFLLVGTAHWGALGGALGLAVERWGPGRARRRSPALPGCALLAVGAAVAAGVVAWAVLPRAFARVELHRAQRAADQVSELARLVPDFRAAHGGRASDDLMGLVAWSIGPRATQWLTDPWGRPLVYDRGTEAGAAPTITCLGRDGRHGGDGVDADFVR